MKTPNKQTDPITDDWPFPVDTQPRKHWAITAFIDGFMNAVDPTRWFRDLDWPFWSVMAVILFAWLATAAA